MIEKKARMKQRLSQGHFSESGYFTDWSGLLGADIDPDTLNVQTSSRAQKINMGAADLFTDGTEMSNFPTAPHPLCCGHRDEVLVMLRLW